MDRQAAREAYIGALLKEREAFLRQRALRAAKPVTRGMSRDEERAYLRAMESCVRAAGAYCLRYADAAEKLAAENDIYRLIESPDLCGLILVTESFINPTHRAQITALMNARSDARLSSRSVAVVSAGFELNAQAERKLAELDGVLAQCAAVSDTDEAYLDAVRGNLPDGLLLDEEQRLASWELSDGLRTLSCAVEVLPLGSGERFSWRVHRLTAVTEEVWN